jgi:hypothetical protein
MEGINLKSTKGSYKKLAFGSKQNAKTRLAALYNPVTHKRKIEDIYIRLVEGQLLNGEEVLSTAIRHF